MKKSNPKKGGIEPKDEMPSFTPPSNMDASEFVATGKKTNKGSIAPHDDTHLLDMKCIPLKDIRLSPTNPRTTFDDKKTEELAESIRIKGVLQPILVRPAPHATVPYEIVFGSRRYKAAVLAKRTDIPATIRKLTDDEVIEIQITENLQREDVSPMEEAVAFKNLLMSGKLDIKGISERIGKTPHFVANRIKLCDLTEDWQKALSEERLTITSALQVCKLSVVDQEELYEQNEHEDHIHIDENDLRDFMYELKDAAFDIADPTLNQEMGPCTTCLLNTGNLMLLFPEDKNDARCTMQTCFKGKLQTTFELEIAKAIENPTVLLVDLSYNYKTQKIGDRSVLRREDVEVIKEPQSPDSTDYASIQDPEYLQELREYESDMLKYKEEIKIATKAFVIDGYQEKGKTIAIRLTSDNGTSNLGSPNASRIAEIQQELRELENKEIAAQNRDYAKLLPELWALIPAAPDGDRLVMNESSALTMAIFNTLSWVQQNEYLKDLHIDVDRNEGNHYALFDHLNSIPKPGDLVIPAHKAIRMFIRQHLGQFVNANPTTSGHAAMLMEVASLHDLDKYTALVNETDAKRTQRSNKLRPRINELKEQLAELTTTKNPKKK